MRQMKKHGFVHLMVLIGLIFSTACAAAPNEPVNATPLPNPNEDSQEAADNGLADDNDQQEVIMVDAMITSNLPRESLDAFPAEILNKLVQANHQFAFDFYHQLAQSNPMENVVISPYSINLALTMAAGGAAGQTAEEMRQVLHTQPFGGDVHTIWNVLSAAIESRSESVDDQAPGFDLRIANAIWGQAGYAFEADYLDLLAKNYGAGLRLADFKTAPEQSRVEINDWVADQTEERIPELIPAGAIHPLTRLALINAVYFKAPWRFPFNPENTTQETFTLRSAEVVKVPMMHQTQDLSYLQTENLTMVVLPYSAGKLEMVLIQPSPDYFETFEQDFTAETLQSIRGQQEWGGVRLSLPRYQFSTDVNLKAALSAMGMPTAFDPDQADFSDITREEQIYIDAALHKAFIDVNEEGTEAAGATAILLAGKSMPAREPVEISFDSPFFFILQDRETGSILFYGRVMNPLEN